MMKFESAIGRRGATSPIWGKAGVAYRPARSDEPYLERVNENKSTRVILPDIIQSESELDDLLTRPRDVLVEFISQLRSPLVVLGASGKMGPTLCMLARRAADAAGHDLRVVAASRFSDSGARRWLEARGIETVECDLLNRRTAARLPDAENVVCLVGLKFGTRHNPSLTWAVNTLVPSNVAERYSASRIVALSTGNVYPLVPAGGGGAVETDSPAPVGEYGITAMARERIFEYHSRASGTRIVLLRLNYAVELRYGVLLDVAQKVWRNEPIDLSAGYLNCLWQGDANEAILRSLALACIPPAVLNMTGPATLSVRELADQFGKRMSREPTWIGTEAETALLSNSSRLTALLGPPSVPLERVLDWTAQWVMRNGSTLNKPTHFEVRSGEF